MTVADADKSPRNLALARDCEVVDRLDIQSGGLEQLWPLVDRLGQGTRGWRSYADREPNATDILTYESSTIPGLLQTEPYARTVVEAVRPTCPRT